MNLQRGQTLIETLVAAFILVMGISAALTLAIYSLSATTNIKQQAIALGLAREGIEVVKNVRDTNWLVGSLTSNCYDFLSGGSTAYCYQDWLDPLSGRGQDISAPGVTPQSFALQYDSNLDYPWVLSKTSTDFGLNLVDFSTFDNSPYYLAVTGLTGTQGNSGFARKVTVSEDTFSPFDRNTGPRLKVTSQVWWSGKNCVMTDDVPSSSKCLVTLVTYLTNWKNF